MDDRLIEKNDEIELNLQRLFEAVMQRMWQIVISTVLCAVIAFMGTFYLMTPQYQSAAMFYVNNNSVSVGDAALSITNADIVASKSLVDSYIVILNTRTTLKDVIDYAGVDRTVGEVKGMLEAAAVNETEIFRVVVTSEDPKEAERIADAIAYILPKRISSIIEGTSAKVVDAAVVASSPSSPSYSKNTMIGLLFGLVLSVAIIALRELFDITIRNEDDITQITKHPILAAVPDMVASSKGGYYAYGDKKKEQKFSFGSSGKDKRPLIGSNISFAASEAYKLLRTKLQFSFVTDNGSHVIGVSSALSGEGKSLTAVNLAHALSQLDKKVVLVDCDMRRPTLAEKLNIKKYPGLSNYLTWQSELKDLLQMCGIPGEEKAFHVITAGQNPPNPIELLSSSRMEKFLEIMRKNYDYVILDLPPIGEVSDAMAVAKNTDGLLFVVRKDYCDRIALGEAVRQFDFVGAKILGVVFNCASESSGRYGYGRYGKYGKKYYRRYYKRYYGRPENSYAESAERANRRSENRK